jgi:hypothetical protein
MAMATSVHNNIVLSSIVMLQFSHATNLVEDLRSRCLTRREKKEGVVGGATATPCLMDGFALDS